MNTPPSLSQLDIPESFLEGWTSLFNIPYTEGISAAGLRSVPADAKHVFVGARCVRERENILVDVFRVYPSDRLNPKKHDTEGRTDYKSLRGPVGFGSLVITFLACLCAKPSQPFYRSSTFTEAGYTRLSQFVSTTLPVKGALQLLSKRHM